MPTVIGVNQVSGKLPPKSKWYQDLGRYQGRSAEKLTDAVLALLTKGAYQGGGGSNPTPQNPGSLTFPSGASTPTSPSEMDQIRQMGGVPTTSGQIQPVGRPGASIPGGVNYVPPVPQTIDQTKYQLALQDLDPNSPQNLYKSAMANVFSGQTPTVPSQPQNPASQGVFTPEDVESAGQAAAQGDPDAIGFLNYLRRQGGQ